MRKIAYPIALLASLVAAGDGQAQINAGATALSERLNAPITFGVPGAGGLPGVGGGLPGVVGGLLGGVLGGGKTCIINNGVIVNGDNRGSIRSSTTAINTTTRC